MPGTMMPQSGDSRMDEVAEDAFLDWLLNRATRDECLDALDRLTAEEARGLLWRVCDEYVRRGLRTARAF